MTWRLATPFVLTAEMRLSTGESGEDAILAVGVSRHERVGLRAEDPRTRTSLSDEPGVAYGRAD